jgi:aryl-alcohol dehydrogenase-like predicted oxidoreductase
MRKTTLGRTGLEITQLGYGALEVRGTKADDDRGRMPNEDHAGHILNGVLDSGINFIDTAWCYGRSEEMMGRYINKRRDEYILAGKTGHGRCSAKGPFGSYTRDALIGCVEKSLQDLQVDYFDVLQLHNPTAEDVEENGCIEVLQEIKAKGLTRFLGVSSVLPHLEKHLATGVYDVFQIPYSALEPEHHDIITKIAEAGGGTIIRGGVAKGEPASAAVAASRVENWKPSLGGSSGLKRWNMFEEAKLDEFRQENESRTAFLLRFTISHPHIHTIIVGTQNPDHLNDNVEAAQRGPLSPETYAEIKKRLESVGLKHGA